MPGRWTFKALNEVPIPVSTTRRHRERVGALPKHADAKAPQGRHQRGSINVTPTAGLSLPKS
jgi:hypothetical protein